MQQCFVETLQEEECRIKQVLANPHFFDHDSLTRRLACPQDGHKVPRVSKRLLQGN